MRNSKLLFWISLFIFLGSLILLVTGSELLLFKIIDDPTVPLGSLTTTLGFLSLTFIVSYIVFRTSQSKHWNRFFYGMLSFSFILSLFWLPLGRYLSGNWSNSFINRPDESLFFWNYTYFTVSFPLGILLLFAFKQLWMRMAKK